MSRAASIFASLLAAASAILVPGAHADSRDEWRGYAWQSIDVQDCLPDTTGALTCPPFHEKWDWKRDQWVDILIAIDPSHQVLHLRQQLTDNDRRDSDYVCVTALVVDAQGRNLAAHHQNWLMRSGQSRAADFTYPSPAITGATRIHLGSKQCRDGDGQDDAIYAGVLARMGRPEDPMVNDSSR